MTMQAPSSRFRTETAFEAAARAWPASGVLGRVRRLLKPAFEMLVEWHAGAALESRFPGGEIARIRPRWRNLSWNPDEYAAFRETIRPGDIVLEAGANAGGYAILFGQWVGPSGRVYAFEPDPRAFTALEDHVALNGLAPQVLPIRAAVSAASGSARLQLASTSGLSRISSADAAGQHVETVSIDDFCARMNIVPGVIKIDVEGAELDVLRGARRTIAAAGAKLRLFVEMHPSLWPESGITVADIVRECEASELTLERLDGGREGLWETEGACLRLRPSGGAR
jgi:FkbM family methyltransferase